MRKSTIQQIKLSDIQRDGPEIQVLTPEQERRIKAIRETFLEVFPCTLEKAFSNFRKDSHPDREITVWEGMAEVYKAHLQSYKTPEARKTLFKAILQSGRPPAS